MKQISRLLVALTVLLYSGCALAPPIEETSREEIKSDRAAEQSDAFARSLPQ